jgi:hypothetical protein
MWRCGDEEDLTPLRRSAELGFAFAQALMAVEVEVVEKVKFAELAAAQGRTRWLLLAWAVF